MTYGRWGLALWNIMAFALFLFFLPFRKRVDKRPVEIYLAFIVSLFVEMYGVPLTVYVLMGLLGARFEATSPLPPFYTMLGLTRFYHSLGTLGLALLVVGMVLVILGWKEIHEAGGGLVTTGVYRHVRHPQYLGFIVMTAGMALEWATIPVLLMWPFLAWNYYRACLVEEKELVQEFGGKYGRYRDAVPMLLPVPSPLRPRGGGLA